MKIYLVIGYDWDDIDLDSVWSTESQATERQIELDELRKTGGRFDYEVQEFELGVIRKRIT